MRTHSAQKTASVVEHFDTLPNSAHVRLPVVTTLFGIGATTAWRWVKTGRLPAPVKLSPGVSAWRVGDLRAAAQGATQAGA